jgi:hypothetical protein
MNIKTRCKICGCGAIAIIFLNSYPICRDCFVKLREYPDIINRDVSIEIPTDVSFSTTSIQVSASSTSTTTTQSQII